MIAAPYTYIAGGLALLAALGGSYAYGRSDGRSLERDAKPALTRRLLPNATAAQMHLPLPMQPPLQQRSAGNPL